LKIDLQINLLVGIFEKPWNPPAPDFLQNSGATYNGSSVVDWQLVNWWTLMDPQAGLFGYAFTTPGVPASFYFEGIVGETFGWATQNFFNFQDIEPPTGTFDIPDYCSAAPVCTNWG